MIYTKGSSANGYAEGRANPLDGRAGLRCNQPADIRSVIARLNFPKARKPMLCPRATTARRAMAFWTL